MCEKLKKLKPKSIISVMWNSPTTIYSSTVFLNTLVNKNILDQSKVKDFADDKINVTRKLNFNLGRVEIIVGKRENAGYQHFYQHFSPFPTVLSKAFFLRVIKSLDRVVKS